MTDYISKNKKYSIISIVFFISIWAIISIGVDSSIKLPTPIDTLKSIVEIVTDENFFIEILSTLKRTIISFFIAFIMGVILGIISGFSTLFFYLFKPIINVLTAMPTMAVILLSLIWLNREVSPILVGILIVFPIIYTSVVDNIKNIDYKLLEMAKVFNLSRRKKFKHLYLPSIKSNLISISSTAISLNIKVIIAAEVLSQPKFSIGTGLQIEKISLNTSGVIAWAIIAILLSSSLEFIILKTFKKTNK